MWGLCPSINHDPSIDQVTAKVCLDLSVFHQKVEFLHLNKEIYVPCKIQVRIQTLPTGNTQWRYLLHSEDPVWNGGIVLSKSRP